MSILTYGNENCLIFRDGKEGKIYGDLVLQKDAKGVMDKKCYE